MLNTPIRSYPCWIAILCCSYLLAGASSAGGSNDNSIFILAGQSNMAGRGGVIDNVWDRVVPPQSNPNPSAVVRLNAKLRWVEAREPLHRDIDVNHTCGVGPGVAFANSLMNSAPRVGVVGLVPCAVGGTNISQWARGGHLYGQMVRRAKVSVRDGGTIQALVWYQGESDTVVRSDVGMYKQRLEKLLSDIRSDLQSPMLPIIQVAIASGEGPYIDEVREAQMAVDLLNLKTVDAKGLPLEPDNLHLTTAAQVQLAQKLSITFLQFLPTQVESNAGNVFVQTNAANFLHVYCLYTAVIALLCILQ